MVLKQIKKHEKKAQKYPPKKQTKKTAASFSCILLQCVHNFQDGRHPR